MEIRWLFKIAVSDSRRGMFHAFTEDYGCQIGPETRNTKLGSNATSAGPAGVEKIENQGRCTWERRGAGDSKSPSLIRAAEGIRPLPVIKDVELVRKHETGLECDQRLSRKLRIKVATAVGTWHRTGCSVPQFSRQPLIPFESRFVFPDRFDTHNQLRRPKPSRGANQRRRFSGCPSSCSHSKFLGNFRLSQPPLAPFELCFVILDQFNTSKHLIESKILCRSFQGCKI